MTHNIVVATDLRNQFGPVRDQGLRPTCLAFAASDIHASLRDGWVALSCEFAFYHAQLRAGRPPTKGALLSSMLDTLKHDGQPREEGWPYLTVVPNDHAKWKPPPTVGTLFGRKSELGGQALDTITCALDGGRPVVVLSTLSRSFFLPDPEGVVNPAAGEQPEAAQRHAIVAVGHGTVDRRPAFLVRNSWGKSWGIEGYAWLTEDFLMPRVFGTAILTENVDVSGRSVTA